MKQTLCSQQIRIKLRSRYCNVIYLQIPISRSRNEKYQISTITTGIARANRWTSTIRAQTYILVKEPEELVWINIDPAIQSSSFPADDFKEEKNAPKV